MTQPLVLDADALNIVSEAPEMLASLQRPFGFDPPTQGEMGQTVRDFPPGGCRQNRVQVVREASRQWGAVVVLKGARTLVGGPQGGTFGEHDRQSQAWPPAVREMCWQV
ncbi:MAG: NAD(P)H-hydrate dehydratase [Bacillota bacterium]